MFKSSFVYWIICLFVFLLIFLEFFHPITSFTQDLGRHLLLGKIILATHNVPKINLFSYTYSNFPFVNSHWASEVIFYLISKYLGLFGLLFIMSSLTAISILILVFQTINHKQYAISTIVIAIVSGILLERTDLRPEIFSFFFMSIFMSILFRNRQHFTKWIFLLPFLELLWVNIHIYFAIGPLLIFLFFLDSLWSEFHNENANLKDKNSKFLYKILNTKYLILFCVLLLTSLATLLNPNGIYGALYPFTVFQNYGYTIAENQSLFFLINYGFRHWSYLFFSASVIGLFILLLLRRKQTRPIDWLLAIIFTIISVSNIRSLPLFVFATLSTSLYLISKYKVSNKIVSLFIFFIIGLFIYLFIQENGLGFAVVPGYEKATDFYLKNDIHGPIFNNFDIGSFLDYRLYPKERVFVDSRPEAYPKDFFQKIYIPMQQNPSIFTTEESKYRFNSIIFSITDQTPWARQFFQNISRDNSWNLVYLDLSSAIWLKKDGINKNFAQKNNLTDENFSLNQNGSVVDFFQLANFLNTIGWKNSEIKVLKKIISVDPINCIALGLLAQNPASRFLYQQQYIYNCMNNSY